MPPKKIVKPIKTSDDPDVSTSQEYFNLTKEYEEKYGKKTIVLMQVGAFFEVYGVKNEETENITHSNIVEFSNVCQMNIAEKKISYGNDSKVVMAGFRDFAFDKYISILTNAGFTVPVFIQHKLEKGIVRKLDRVYSTGTFLSYDADSCTRITNNIMCIWIETYKVPANTNKMIVYGAAVVDIFTGKSSIFQHEMPFYLNTTTFDELEKFVSIYEPSETILLSSFEQHDLNTIIQYIGLNTNVIHKIALNEEKAVKCGTQKYVKHVLTEFFGEESYDICSEFWSNSMATQAFCYLLNFIQEHNPDLVRKIGLPEFNNTSHRLILANHTLAQLNIIASDGHGQYSSVLSLLNKCCSAMGKRKFQHQLTNPTFDEAWLQQEYDITNHMLLPDCYSLVELFRKQLRQMRDIEKISRQLVVKKLYPSSLHHLYVSIQRIQQMNESLIDNPFICNYLCGSYIEYEDNNSLDAYDMIQRTCIEIHAFLEQHLYMERCKQCDSMVQFNENIIKPGVSTDLDILVEEQIRSKTTFDLIHRYLNTIMSEIEKNDIEYVKVHETEKSGVTLQVTSKRSQILKKALDENFKSESKKQGIITLSNGEQFSCKDVKFKSAGSTNMDIEFPLLDKVCKQLLSLKDRINDTITKKYFEILTIFENQHFDNIKMLADYVSMIDVMQSKAYIAREYNYCCPILDSTRQSNSFVEAVALRHCLIEHIQQNELYVTNDVTLNASGMLLYGTNAVGKTSLIRALGIATVMAQAGLFVPCTSFTYKPYTAIFSRILGNDNIFKGLSTFAVEMSELRIILKMADERSMILGDELCSGTEMESALSIFVTGLIRLHEVKSSFIFATHFHEITEYDEIKALERLCLNHMAVRYDREKDCIIYDRKLKAGSGPRIYGLEVCKSLHLDNDFIESAYAIRNKYYPETKGELSHGNTIYNSNKIRGKCEICKNEIGEEIHHMQQQKDADANGFIGSFHKNHRANLLTVCENCHRDMHSTNEVERKKKPSPTTRKKTTKGYVLE